MIGQFKKIIAISLIVVFISVFASTDFSLANDGEDCSMTIVYSGEKGPISGSTFSIWHVGSLDKDGNLNINGQFSIYPLNFHQTEAGGWRTLADTLEAYILRDRVPALNKKTTDLNGRLSFTELPQGLYLLAGERTEVDDFSYTPEPMFIFLPIENEGGVNNDAIIEPKKDVVASTHENKITVSVIKVWNDGESTADRPRAIEIELFCDGEKYDSAVLDRSCNWRANWEELDSSKKWTVTEKKFRQALQSW